MLIKELEMSCDKFEISKQRQLEREARTGNRGSPHPSCISTEGTLSLSRR